MDKRIGMNTTARERFTTSAPAQDRRPPATPSALPTRRGRNSDERAHVSSATDRNRTCSPIARNRSIETNMRTNGAAFLADRPSESGTGSSSDVRPPAKPSSYISDADWSASGMTRRASLLAAPPPPALLDHSPGESMGRISQETPS